MTAKLKDILGKEEKEVLKEIDGGAPIDTPINELTLKQLAQIGKEIFKDQHQLKTANAKRAIFEIFFRCEINGISIF